MLIMISIILLIKNVFNLKKNITCIFSLKAKEKYSNKVLHPFQIKFEV